MKRDQVIQRLEKVLRTRRDALRRSISSDFDRVNSVDEHGVGDEIDAALDTGFREIYSGLVEAESRELANIEHALNRIKDGSYGTCEYCHRKIPLPRLQALPYATTCVKCQTLQEKRRRDTENWTSEHFQGRADSQGPADSQRESAFDNLNHSG